MFWPALPRLPDTRLGWPNLGGLKGKSGMTDTRPIHHNGYEFKPNLND
jgi:hypothetical protein